MRGLSEAAEEVAVAEAGGRSTSSGHNFSARGGGGHRWGVEECAGHACYSWKAALLAEERPQ